jgi:hypothetical protein
MGENSTKTLHRFLFSVRRKCGQTPMMVDFTGMESTPRWARAALYTDSAEKPVERAVQNEKEQAKHGLSSALHKQVGVIAQLSLTTVFNPIQTHP